MYHKRESINRLIGRRATEAHNDVQRRLAKERRLRTSVLKAAKPARSEESKPA